MLFSVVSRDSKGRRNITNLMLSLYPGCVVYELEEPVDIAPCLREHALDAVFWELTRNDSQDLSYLNMIRTQHPDMFLLVCSEDDTLLDEAMWNGANMYCIKPLLPEQIQTALGTKRKA